MLTLAPISWEEEEKRGGWEWRPPTWQGGSEGSVQCAVCRRRPYSPVAANRRCHHFLLHHRRHTAPLSTSCGHLEGKGREPQKKPQKLKTTSETSSRGKSLEICSSCELLPNHFLLETRARQTSSCVCGHRKIPRKSHLVKKFEPQWKSQSDWQCFPSDTFSSLTESDPRLILIQVSNHFYLQIIVRLLNCGCFNPS